MLPIVNKGYSNISGHTSAIHPLAHHSCPYPSKMQTKLEIYYILYNILLFHTLMPSPGLPVLLRTGFLITNPPPPPPPRVGEVVASSVNTQIHVGPKPKQSRNHKNRVAGSQRQPVPGIAGGGRQFQGKWSAWAAVLSVGVVNMLPKTE